MTKGKDKKMVKFNFRVIVVMESDEVEVLGYTNANDAMDYAESVSKTAAKVTVGDLVENLVIGSWFNGKPENLEAIR